MSQQYSEQAFVKSLRGADLTLGEYRTLVTAASYADGATGENIRPGATRLARDTGLAVETVYRNLTALVGKGYLIQVVKGRKGQASEFQINVDTMNDRIANPPMTPESCMTPASGKRRKRNHDRQPVNPDARVIPPTQTHQFAKDGKNETRTYARAGACDPTPVPEVPMPTPPVTTVDQLFASVDPKYDHPLFRQRARNFYAKGWTMAAIGEDLVNNAERMFTREPDREVFA